jgi:hypothetical protein
MSDSRIALTPEQALARIAELERKLVNMTATSGITIGTKGGIVCAVPGRWPVTLKAAEWRVLLGKADAIQAFMAEHPEIA